MKIALRAVLFLTFGFAAILSSFAQCPALDFTSPPTACLGEQVKFTPTGTYASYDWDFCPGDLAQPPSVSIYPNPNNIGYSHKVEVVEKDGSYFGFFLSRAAHKLFRLDFGTDPNSTPIPLDLGDLGLNSSTWRTIEIVIEGADYFGFIIDGNSLYRISFGTQLTNAPSNAQQVYTGSLVNNAIDLVSVQDSQSKYLFIANNGDANLVRIQFSGLFSDPIDPINDVHAISITGSGTLGGVAFIKECDTWFAITTNPTTGTLTKIQFVNGLGDPSPVLTTVAAIPLTGISLVQDNGQFYAFTQAQGSSTVFYRIDFGATLVSGSPTPQPMGDFGMLTDVWALSMHRFKSQWMVFSVQNSGTKIFKVNFPNACFGNAASSTATQPMVTTVSSGTFSVSLSATDGSGNISYASKPITVSVNQAPDIDFNSQNACVLNNVNFSAVNTSADLISYAWDFGDTGTSSIGNPSHIYAAATTYNISLVVGASNGCSNATQKSLKVFNIPQADFSVPTGIVCTNQNYIFTNLSTFDSDSSPNWEWRLNGVLSSTVTDFATAFNTTGAQEIRLKALIPGCENESVKNLNTLAGPVVDFSASDNCQGAPVSFTNSSTGADAGFDWNFGDGTVSTQTNPTHTYQAPGALQVALTGKNLQGCQNITTKVLNIYSLPQPAFSVGLPPFSCSNSSTPFQNNTPAPTDSNITVWSWQFGDTGVSTQQAPAHNYALAGDYAVSLTAVTDASCTSTATKTITIAASPTADFTVGTACINQSTKFTDASSGGVQSRLWQIGTASFTVTNPSYTFSAAGDFNTTLTATAANGCSNVKTKTVTVPIPPLLDFTLVNACAGKNTTFTDASSSPTDPVVVWNWNLAGSSYVGNSVQSSFSPDGIYNVKLTTTHVSGCRYTLSSNVTVHPSPVAAFTASPDRGGPPLTVQFVNASQQASTYQWQFKDKTTATSTAISPVYTFTSLGDYGTELTALNEFGCSDVFTATIHVLVPSIDLILEDFSLVNDAATGKLRCALTIFNNSNIPLNQAEVALFLSDKAVVNETVSINLGPGQSTIKTLSFTLSPGQFDFTFLCAEILSEKDIQQDNNKRCINLQDADYVFDPYPNPSSGIVQVDWIAAKPDVTSMVVHDATGRKTYDWKTPSQSGLNRAVLDLAFLTGGLYYLTIETSVTKKTIRFMRQ